MNRTPWWARGRTTLVTDENTRRAHRRGTAAVRTLVALALAGGLLTVVMGTAQPRTRDVGSGVTSTRQSTDSLIGGCGPVFTKQAEPGTAGVVPTVKKDGKTPNNPVYGTIVPMTGPFWSPPAAPDVHMYTKADPATPPPPRLLHNMWAGALVVYYTPAANPEDVKRLAVVADTRPDLNVIVAPWDVTKRGPFPSNRKIAFSTWGASQTCQRLVVVALNQFRAAHPQEQAPGFGGLTPPVLAATTTSQAPMQ